MAPKIKTNNEDILAAAIEIVREQGMEAVNARNLASKLNCSIQPIFRAFSSMEILKAAIYNRVEEILLGILGDALRENKNSFKALGLAYIDFARKEQNMFKLLYMTGTFKGKNMASILGTMIGDDKVIDLINRLTGFDEEKAQRLYTSMWFTVHGMASLLAINGCVLTDEDANQILDKAYIGMVYSLK